MEKLVSDSIGAFYQHYPRITVVVTAHAGERDNAASIAWHTTISKNPPLYTVSIAQGHFTYKLIAQSKEFGVNFLPDTKAELVAAIGGSKGSNIDKFKSFCIAKDNPAKTSVPVLRDAYAAFECKLVDDRLYGDHRMLVGEIVAVHCLKEAFTEEETINLEKVSPVLYMGNEQYLNVADCRIRTVDRKLCVNKLQS
jgi:flavin reductase (DIM6/NTAB) family NADH-FMN oxidoreductase RutF